MKIICECEEIIELKLFSCDIDDVYTGECKCGLSFVLTVKGVRDDI